MKKQFVVLLAVLFIITAERSLLAQATDQAVPIKPSITGKGVFLGETPPLSSLPTLTDEEFAAMKAKSDKKVMNKKLENRAYPFAATAEPKGPDMAWQNFMGDNRTPKAPIVNFGGQASPYYPPDCNGTAGPSHFMQTINSVYAIYNKSGTLVAGPTNMNLLFSGTTGSSCNDGDPLVLYDEMASRWLAIEFSICGSNDYMLVAVSSTSDPTGTWYKYSFDVADMPDYEKFGIWQDGYYMGTNNDSGNDIYVFQRSVMLTGGASPQFVGFDNSWRPTTVDGFMCVPPIDNDGTAAPSGSPALFITINDDAIGGGSDQLWIYELAVNWTTPASSTFTRSQQLNVTTFDSNFGSTWDNITQPTSQKLDAIPMVIMNVPQYRNFGTYQTIVCCHTVDVDATNHAGIRWYELRKTPPATTWTVRQTGTYAPDANSRWMGSIILNGSNQIALGYSVSSSTVYPSIRYCGQSSGAYATGAGVMDLTEESIQVGANAQSSYNRWGDYAQMSVDPSDDKTFWFTTEYIGSGGTRQTKIASFKFGNSPTAITLAATSITSATATLNGTINPNGLSTTYYFEWGTSTSYGNTTAITSAGSGSSNISVNAGISSLIAGTTYHFRVVGVNSDGTTNGSDLTFIPGAAAVSTTAVTGITGTTASSGGNVTTDGGSSVTARGVCWATTTNPVATGNHTTNGTGTGSYTSSITGLSPTTSYYVRAYATNGNGTFYGDNVSFTTACGTYVLPFSQSFASSTLPTCWTKQQTSTATDLWTVSNTNNAGGSAYEMKSTYQNINPAVVRLVTPPLNTVGISQLNLTFKHYIDAYGTGCTFRVQSSTDGITWTNETWALASTSTNVGPATVTTTVSNNLNSTTTYIAFAVDGNLYQYDYWYIDDINVSSACGTTYPVSVSVAASANNICSGTSVTFTATPTNGGSSPTYAWYKNSALVSGVTGATYTYVPANGDVIYCILTSNLACTTGNPATSNSVTMVVNATSAVGVSLAATGTTVCAGTSVTFTATPSNGGSSPTYAWYKNSTLVSGVTGATYSYVPANGDQVYVILTSSLTGCVSGNPATSGTIIMTVNPVLPVSVLLTAGSNNVCSGTSVTFTASPTNGGTTPVYAWYKNGTLVSGVTGATYTYAPANGDQVYVILTSNLSCKSGSPATSNTVTMAVNTLNPVSVSISPSQNPLSSGTTVTFTASPVNGGASPVYAWYKNSVLVSGITGPTYAYVPVNNDQVYAVLTSNINCASGNPATSNTVVMTVIPASNPTYLCELRNDSICDPKVFEFDLYLLNTGSVSFQLASIQAGININPAMRNGGTITVSPVAGSSELNAGQQPTSNKFTFDATKNCIRMTPMANPGIGNGTIISSATPGTRVIRIRLTNTVDFGAVKPDLSWCFSVAACGYPTKVNAYVGSLATEITIQGSHSNTHLINPTLNQAVIAYNVTGSGSICQGDPGLNVCIDGSESGIRYTLIKDGIPTAQSIYGTGSSLCFGVQTSGTYTVSGRRNGTCLTTTMNGSAMITELPALPVSVSVTPSGNPVVEGNLVTFTAVPVNEGSAPLYQWKVNSVDQGTNSPVFSYIPSNNDQVACLLISNASCVTGNPALSNTIIMTVYPGTRTLNLNVFLEGLYEGTGTMRQANDEYGPHFNPGIADKVTVELHNALNYPIIEYSSGPVDLSTSGNVSITGIPAILNGSYYITVKSRSSIETTTSSPVSFAGNPVNYDFSSSATQAFGDNLRNMNGIYLIWSGDVNQDGIVDAGDMNPVDNSATAVTFGYVTEDVNGDGIVDSGDMNIIDNNSTAIIMSFLP